MADRASRPMWWFLTFATGSLLSIASSVVMILFAVERARDDERNDLQAAVLENFRLNKEDRAEQLKKITADIAKIKLGIDDGRPIYHAADWRTF